MLFLYYYAVVNNALNDKGRLYCGFIDLKKSFTVNHCKLWFILYELGINGKLLRIIKNMYSSVKTFKTCNSFTDYFECVVGQKQGKVLSPVVFSLLLEDLELFLQDDPLCGLSIDGILLIIVLFAET